MNDLSALFTKRNLQVLEAINQEDLSFRDIAARLECSPATVHLASRKFLAFGLAYLEKRKNTIIMKPKRDSPLYQKMKSLLNIHSILESSAYKKLKAEGVIAAYGSFAKGTDDRGSDIDLLILSDRSELQLREALRNMRLELKRKINALVVTRRKLQSLERHDKEFYMQLKLTAIALNGETFG